MIDKKIECLDSQIENLEHSNKFYDNCINEGNSHKACIVGESVNKIGEKIIYHVGNEMIVSGIKTLAFPTIQTKITGIAMVVGGTAIIDNKENAGEYIGHIATKLADYIFDNFNGNKLDDTKDIIISNNYNNDSIIISKETSKEINKILLSRYYAKQQLSNINNSLLNDLSRVNKTINNSLVLAENFENKTKILKININDNHELFNSCLLEYNNYYNTENKINYLRDRPITQINEPTTVQTNYFSGGGTLSKFVIIIPIITIPFGGGGGGLCVLQ